MIRQPGDLPERLRFLTSSERRGRFYVVEDSPGISPGFFVTVWPQHAKKRVLAKNPVYGQKDGCPVKTRSMSE